MSRTGIQNQKLDPCPSVLLFFFSYLIIWYLTRLRCLEEWTLLLSCGGRCWMFSSFHQVLPRLRVWYHGQSIFKHNVNYWTNIAHGLGGRGEVKKNVGQTVCKAEVMMESSSCFPVVVAETSTTAGMTMFPDTNTKSSRLFIFFLETHLSCSSPFTLSITHVLHAAWPSFHQSEFPMEMCQDPWRNVKSVTLTWHECPVGK